MSDRKNEHEKNIKVDGRYVYLRPTSIQLSEGKKQIRIFSEQGSVQYYEEIDQARLIMGQVIFESSDNDLWWLIVQYMKSPEFRNLGPSTKKVRQPILEKCARFLCGTSRSYNDVETKEIRAMRDHMSDRPDAANAWVKALRQVYKWALSCDLTEINPAMNVPYLPSKNPHGFYTWTEQEIEQYESVHKVGTKARLAIDIFQYTGVRRSDCILLGPPMERHNNLEFTEEKNKRREPKARVIPILPELRRSIEATHTGPFTYLVTNFDRPFSRAGFGNWFKKRCCEAGLDHCSAHGLRKAAAVKAAIAGASSKELMAIFGWDSIKMAEHYTKAADSKRLVMQSMHYLGKQNAR